MYIDIWHLKSGDRFRIANVFKETVNFSWTCVSEDLSYIGAAVFYSIPPPTRLAPEQLKSFKVSTRYEEQGLKRKAAWYDRCNDLQTTRFRLEFLLNTTSEPSPEKEEKLPDNTFRFDAIPFRSQTRATNSYVYYGRPLSAVYVNIVEEC
jgi:hypothetical protein